MADPIRQLKSLKAGEKSSIYLFNDEEIILKANFKWKNSFITEINFDLKNIHSDVKYKICCITRCIDTYEDLPDYIMIQLSTNTNTDSSSDSIILKKPINFIVGFEQNILFNVSTNDCTEDSDERCGCEFDGTTPETKGGAIIVSI